jgi:hypothetical protein
MTAYCTLADAKRELKASGTVDDDRLFRHVLQISRRIDSIMSPHHRRPYFAPYTEARDFRVNKNNINSYRNTFYLGDGEWLFEHSAITLDGTSVYSSASQYPALDRVYREFQLNSYASTWYDRTQEDTNPALVRVTGVWGYHGDYDNAWWSVDSLAAGITAAATSLSVSDIDGDDFDGFSPRISRGNLLLIGTEVLEVTDTNTTTNVATVRRGQNGTTAAAHSLADAVKTWQVDEPIRRVTARQAALMYAREGAFQIESIDGVGEVSYPQDLLTEVKMTLSEYMYG